MFDPRAELNPLQRAVRDGFMLLQELVEQPTAANAFRIIQNMRPGELHGLAMLATINQKKALGATTAEIQAWLRQSLEG